MFKNTLFFKIIVVFTIPALGILYFSSVLVYDKINFLSKTQETKYNLKYMQVTEKLIHSLQKERGLSTSYEKRENLRHNLNEQKIITDKRYAEYLDFVKNTYKINIEYYIKQIENDFNNLKTLRADVKSYKIDNLHIISKYTKTTELLLNSILSMKSIELSFDFNKEFLNIFYFLVYKESCAIERALVIIALMNDEVSSEVENELLKIQLMQKNTLTYFKKNFSAKMLEIYNHEITDNFVVNVDAIRLDLKNKIKEKAISAEEWWHLSTEKIDKLDFVFDKIILELNNISGKIQTKAALDKNISLLFLFVSFSTLISLFFVLRSIILNNQKSYDKIEKQKKVYELLNKTNKYLLKDNTKNDFYLQINKIISKNQNMVFSFIYDFEDNSKHEIFTEDSDLKDYLFTRADELKDLSNDNLLTKAIKLEKNLLIESFKIKNISIFYEYAKKYNIKSAAAFPIKKFGKIISVLVMYSNEDGFFDYEIEILFDKMINDLSHSLEKIEYEKIRLLQETKLKISSLAFESSEPMIITDEKANIINVNHAFCEVLEYEKEKLIGENPRKFKSLHQKNEFYTSLWKDLIENDSWTGEIYNTKYSGEIIPFRVTITTIRDSNNNIKNYLGQYIDISEQKDKQEILEYQATHDNLTALPNRLLLLDRIERAITKVIRHNIVGGLIFIDLDNFKSINDTLGHGAGDTLLITVAKKLRDVVREEDTISRIGGDEFIVLADNIGSNTHDARVNIEILAEKVKDSLNSIEFIDGFKNISTPSIGVTLFNDDSVSVKDIIKQADTAMYAAKKQGKNTIEFFN